MGERRARTRWTTLEAGLAEKDSRTLYFFQSADFLYTSSGLNMLVVGEKVDIGAIPELTISGVAGHFGKDVMFHKPSHELVCGSETDLGLIGQIVDRDNGV